MLRRRGLLGRISEVLKTVKAALVHVTDAKAKPAVSVKAYVEPAQDLHGYDNPWPAGGGVNQLPCGSAFTVTENGITLKSDGRGTYTLSGTATADFEYKFSTQTNVLPSSGFIHFMNSGTGFHFDFYSGTTKLDNFNITTQDRHATLPSVLASKTIDGLGIRVNNGTVISGTLTLSPMIDNINNNQTFSPCSNICPITGFTGANVVRTGKNLLTDKFYNGFGYNRPIGEQLTLVDITETVTANDGVYSKTVTEWDGIGMLTDKLQSGTYHIVAQLAAAALKFTGYILDADKKVLSKFDVTGSGTSLNINRILTLLSDGYVFIWLATGIDGNVSISHPQLELGSTATAYEPYSGTTYSITFPVMGKNVYNPSGIDMGYVLDASTGELVENSGHMVSDYLPVQGGVTYTLSGTNMHKRQDGEIAMAGIRIAQYDANKVKKTVSNPADTMSATKTFTTEAGTAYVRIQTGGDATNLQLEAASSATTYEPYNNTVYGGEVDVTSGKVKVDRAEVDMGSITWNYNGIYGGVHRFNTLVTSMHTGFKADVMSSIYKSNTSPVASSGIDYTICRYNGAVYVNDNRFTNGTDLKTALDGQTMVYPLATPIEYSLTPQQVQMLLGENNLWNDCNGDTEVTYKASVS